MVQTIQPSDEEGMTPGEKFLSWPGWSHLTFAWKISAVIFLFFILIYGGCDHLTSLRSFRFKPYLEWELKIPFVPAFATIYMSIYLLFLAAPFVLRTRAELMQLGRSLCALILSAGAIFLLFPAECGFSPEKNPGIWSKLYEYADQINLTYNMVPSLHVGLTVVCVSCFAKKADMQIAILLWTWAGLVALSTLLTHQHHLLDVFSGWVMAIACTRVFLHSEGRVEPPLTT